MSPRFENRNVVVTGGGQGIGLGVARRLLSEGARVAILDSDIGALGAVVAELESQPVMVHRVDVRDRNQVRTALGSVVDAWGHLDVLVASAGIAAITPLMAITDSDWAQMFEVNVFGTFIAVQEAALAMGERGGSMVVVASTNAFFVEEETAHYSASKGALVSFVRAAALDLAHKGIRINAINPGLIRSRLSAVLIDDPEAGQAYLERIPLGRWGEPSDIAAVAAFLASDDAAYMTGEAVTVDGGVSLGVALNVAPSSTAE